METPIKIEKTPIVVQSDGAIYNPYPSLLKKESTTTQPRHVKDGNTAWKPITWFKGEKPTTFFGQIEKIAGDSGHISDNVSSALQLGLQFTKQGKASQYLGALDLGHDLSWFIHQPTKENAVDVIMDIPSILWPMTKKINLKKSYSKLGTFWDNHKVNILNKALETGNTIDAISDSHPKTIKAKDE